MDQIILRWPSRLRHRTSKAIDRGANPLRSTMGSKQRQRCNRLLTDKGSCKSIRAYQFTRLSNASSSRWIRLQAMSSPSTPIVSSSLSRWAAALMVANGPSTRPSSPTIFRKQSSVSTSLRLDNQWPRSPIGRRQRLQIPCSVGSNPTVATNYILFLLQCVLVWA